MIKRPATAGLTSVGLKGNSPSASKKKAEDDWGDAADDLLESLGGPAAGGAKRSNNNDLFNNQQQQQYSGFGILGKQSSSKNFPTFGTKRNSTGNSNHDEDDLLDNILDNIEEKKGIESTKQKSDKKDNSFGSQPRYQQTKSQIMNDPWSREHLDDLEDVGFAPAQVDDTRSKKSGASQSILDKKKALFGLGGTPDQQPKAKQSDYFASNPDDDNEEEEEDYV